MKGGCRERGGVREGELMNRGRIESEEWVSRGLRERVKEQMSQ